MTKVYFKTSFFNSSFTDKSNHYAAIWQPCWLSTKVKLQKKGLQRLQPLNISL